MNEIVYKFLLAGDKFMPEMHLKHPRFAYSSCGPFTKNKKRIQKFKETGDTKYVYRNKLDKACFQHDMAYGNFKDLAKRTGSDKVLRDKGFNIAKNAEYDGCKRGLPFMVHTFFDKKTSAATAAASANKFAGSGIPMIQNGKLAEELHKLIIKNKIKKEFILYLKTIFGVLIMGYSFKR